MKAGPRFSDIDTVPNRRLPAISGYLNGPTVPLEKAGEPLHGLIPYIDRHITDAKKYTV